MNTFTVTASNSTSGETGTSSAKTITVTDPPAFQAGFSNLATLGYSSDDAPGAFMADAGSHAASAALLRQYLASSFVTAADRPGATPISNPSQSHEQWLTLPHAGAAA